jgi:hypothetical protein
MTLSNDNINPINPRTVHSRPYVPEGHGACERFIHTVSTELESDVRSRDRLLSLDELNGCLEAWLAEHYHQVVRERTKGGNTP